jgi:hypothetical protein
MHIEKDPVKTSAQDAGTPGKYRNAVYELSAPRRTLVFNPAVRLDVSLSLARHFSHPKQNKTAARLHPDLSRPAPWTQRGRGEYLKGLSQFDD